MLRKNNKQFDERLKMLNYYQEEFLYRHRHFWSVLIKSFLLVVAIATIPITSEIFGIVANELVRSYLFIFPVLSTIFSFLCFFVLLEEAMRLNTVNNTKCRIMSRLPHIYRCEKYKTRGSLSIFLSVMLLVVGIGISIVVMVIIKESSSVVCSTCNC